MLLELLKRDLRLHRMLLVTPLVLALFLGAAPTLAEASGGMALFLALLLPLSIQLREQSEGTLGSLLALPLPRAKVVQLRFLEAGLMPMATFLLMGLEGVFLHAFRASFPPPLSQGNLSILAHPMAMAWTCFWCFAYPLPLLLRWDLKGLGAALGLPMLGLFALGQVLLRARSASWAARMVNALVPTWQWIQARAGLEWLLVLGLLTLCYVLALQALSGKDL